MNALILLCLVSSIFAKHEEYIGWKSYYVAPSSVEQLESLGLMIPGFDLDFLSWATTDREGLVLVKPEHQDQFINALESEGIQYWIHVDDVKAQLDLDDEDMETHSKNTPAKGVMAYDRYQRLEVIYAYLDRIAEQYPNLVKLETPAHSFEGRPIKYLKISSTNFEDESKSIVFIEAAIHAREWITPPVATYAIHKLVENVTNADMIEEFDWIILPVANPDGYAITHNGTRFWRKTRSTDHEDGERCPGVDGNRNFDFLWNTVGVSSDPCANTYPGRKAFSEVETRVIRDILHENLNRMVMYLSMHSYGSMVLYSWGHDGSLSNYAFAQQTTAVNMITAIQVKKLPEFPNYTAGNSKLVVGYATSGSSQDYAHYIGLPLAYTYELPGLGPGLLGFSLSARYISHVVDETWDGIVVGARRARQLYGPYPFLQ
ncbi:carboxypeptidase B [Pieris rapae]|uniref:carboxypeptidase B n=1 Tax=Pieris rapae TaxID=64459 RepID=UPI001E27DEB7|nr:carboxypeptidase B [Pieris rapae]